MDKLKLIKGIVFVITFLLVFGILMLGTIIYQKTHTEQPVYTTTDLEQPAGSSIHSITQADGNLAVLVKGGGQPDRVVIFNLQTLQKITTLAL